MNTYQLPGFYLALEWHRAVREFFETKEHGGKLEDRFVHADEAETSLGLELFPEMVEMKYAKRHAPCPGSSTCRTVISTSRSRISCGPTPTRPGPGHIPLELVATPEAVVGRASPPKPARPSVRWSPFASTSDLLCEHILETWPPGRVPDPQSTTFRTNEEMEPYLREPGSEGWKSVYSLRRIGPY